MADLRSVLINYETIADETVANEINLNHSVL